MVRTDSAGRYSFTFEVTPDLGNARGVVFLRATTPSGKCLINSGHVGF